MPDWKVGKFEAKFSDEFARSNNKDHEKGVRAVSSDGQKLKHEDASGKSSEGVISGVKSSDSLQCNSEHMHSANGIVSEDINHDRGGDCKAESNDFPLNTEDTIAQTRYPTDNWNSCQFALSNGSPAPNNQSAAQNGLGYGDNDLNYIDWPGIDNFEDVDTLFRGCDSTYGQQQLENTDELPWIPSSDAIYSADVALQQGFDTSYTDYDILDDLSSFHCTQDKSLPTADLFNDQKNTNVYSEQAYQGDAMDLLSTDQICNGHRSLDMIGNQYLSEDAMQQPEEEKFSVASGSQLSSSHNLLKQRHHLDSTSPSNITSESYPERSCQFSPSGASFEQRNFKVQKTVANLQPRQPISDNVVDRHPGHQTLTRRASYPCEDYEIKKMVLGKRRLGEPQVTMGTSMVVDGSFVSSISSDNSVEESSFRQLQDAVSQLDVKTKLCIRDGLYRLARSAQNRPFFPNTINSNGDSHDVKDMQNAETPCKFVDPRSIETQTNPIDRSIALLLFHQPSDHTAGAVDESSLKSHNENHHQATVKNQGVMPASSMYSARGQGGPR